MNIGFIGLGNMGSGIAANILSSGQNLIVHDLNQAAAAELLENGAPWAEDPATVAALSDVVDELEARDHSDRTRNTSPLMMADDAVRVATTGIPLDGVVARVLEIVRTRLPELT